MTEKELTDEETELGLSAQEAHNLIELCNTNGWKLLREKYFDVRLKECREYLCDIKNTDMALIQAKRLMVDFIETMLNEIEMQVKIGLEDEEELVKRKEKKKKK